jgi:ribosomal protein S18 acetylase RimI-like enzyme
MVDPGLLDRLAANATAPTSVVHLGGWELRADPSLPFRRSNSLVPFGDGAGFDVEERIDEVERRYRDLDLPSRFQIVPSSAPPDLDERLARRGYAVEAPVDLLTAEVDQLLHATRIPETAFSTRIGDAIDAAWTDALVDGDWSLLDRIRGYGRLLTEPARRGHVAMVDIGRAPTAIGFSVVESDWVGVFGMATSEARRRRGAATMVLRALAQRAASDGATRVYLQVEVDNAVARRLYESAGFASNHSYHYRVAL